jgi:hypothetical protein
LKRFLPRTITDTAINLDKPHFDIITPAVILTRLLAYILVELEKTQAATFTFLTEDAPPIILAPKVHQITIAILE